MRTKTKESPKPRDNNSTNENQLDILKDNVNSLENKTNDVLDMAKQKENEADKAIKKYQTMKESFGINATKHKKTLEEENTELNSIESNFTSINSKYEKFIKTCKLIIGWPE